MQKANRIKAVASSRSLPGFKPKQNLLKENNLFILIETESYITYV